MNTKLLFPTVLLSLALPSMVFGQHIFSVDCGEKPKENSEWTYDEATDDWIENVTTTIVSVLNLSFSAEQGKQYAVECTTSLGSEDWDAAQGWQTNAENLETDDFTASTSVYSDASTCFFRITEIDGIGPTFAFVSPDRDAVGVETNASIVIRIEDPSGVDSESLGIRIDDARVDPDSLTWNDPFLTYTPLTGCLGTNGQHLTISAYAEDSKGNFMESEQSEIVLEETLIVKNTVLSFASFSDFLQPAPASSGDQNNRFSGPATVSAKAISGSPELLGVKSDSLVFASSNGLFLGQLVCGVVDMIPWYRRIASISVNEDGTATASTEEASLMDFFESGTFDSCDATFWALYEENEDGEFVLVDYAESGNSATSSDAKGLRVATRGLEPFSEKFKYANSWNPSLPSPFSVRNFLSYSFETTAQLTIDKGSDTADFYFKNSDFTIDFHPVLSLSASGTKTYSKNVISKKWRYCTMAGYVPVVVVFELGVDAGVLLSGSAEGSVTTGTRLHSNPYLHLRASGLSVRKESASWTWTSSPYKTTFDFNGNASATFNIPCKLGAYAYGALGAYAKCTPYLTISASGSTATQSISKKCVAGADGEIAFDVKGVDVPWVCDKTTWPFSMKKWTLFDDEVSVAPPSFSFFPSDMTVPLSFSVGLQPEVAGGQPISYRWFKDGRDLNRTTKDLAFTMTSTTPGTYKLVATNPFGSASREVAVSLEEDLDNWIGVWRLDFQYAWTEFQYENGYDCSHGYHVNGPLQIESWHREIRLFRDKTATIHMVDDSYWRKGTGCPYGCSVVFADSWPVIRQTNRGSWDILEDGRVSLRCKYDNSDTDITHILRQPNHSAIVDEDGWKYTKRSSSP